MKTPGPSTTIRRARGGLTRALAGGGLALALVGGIVSSSQAQEPPPTNTLTVTGTAECHPDRDGRWIASFTADASSTDPANTWTMPLGWSDANTPLGIDENRTLIFTRAANVASYSVSTLATFTNGGTANGSFTAFRPDGCDAPAPPDNSLVIDGTAACLRDLDGRWTATFTADADSTDPTNTWDMPALWSDAGTPISIDANRVRTYVLEANVGGQASGATATFANGPTAVGNSPLVSRPTGCALVNAGQITVTAECAATDNTVRLTFALSGTSARDSNEYEVVATNQTWSPTAATSVDTSISRTASIEVPDDADHTVTATIDWLVGVNTVVDRLAYTADDLDCAVPAGSAPVTTTPTAVPAAPAAAAPVAEAPAANSPAAIDPSGSLPETGTETTMLMLAGTVLVLAGLVALRMTRRTAS